MAHSPPQTQGNGKPMFMLTLMGDSDPAIRESFLQGPAETGLPQEAIDLMATTTKSRGDAFYKNGEWGKARDTYMEAAGLLASDPKFHTTLMLNCAAANIKLRRWEEVLCDTSEVLEADPKSVKALFRSARALIELKNFDEALDCCDRALKLEPHNQSLREERRAAEQGVRQLKNSIVSILREAYEYYHLRIVNDPFAPPTQPSFLPYFDPPIPIDYKKTPLFCAICLVYVERHATDMISDFPSNAPLHRLLDTLLPGPTGASSASSTSPSSPETRLTRVRNPASKNKSSEDLSMDHPKSWDPKYEFRPSNVSMYAEMHDNERIYIEPGMTLVNVFAEAMRLEIEYPEEEKIYIEIKHGMIPIYVFRSDSEAEERWGDRDYSTLTDLGDPEYKVTKEEMVTTSSRARIFSSGPPIRAVNLPASASYAAREAISKAA